MAFPLTVPQTPHSVTTKVIGGPTIPKAVQLSSPPSRTWHLPTFPAHARTAQTRTVRGPSIPNQGTVPLGNPPNRTWAAISIFENFTFPTYGQWLPRAARDRP